MIFMINKKVSEFPQWLENLEDELSEGAVKIDGYDDCICGIVELFGMENVLLYDTDTIIERLESKKVSYIVLEQKGYEKGPGKIPGTLKID